MRKQSYYFFIEIFIIYWFHYLLFISIEKITDDLVTVTRILTNSQWLFESVEFQINQWHIIQDLIDNPLRDSVKKRLEVSEARIDTLITLLRNQY